MLIVKIKNLAQNSACEHYFGASGSMLTKLIPRDVLRGMAWVDKMGISFGRPAP